MARKNVLEITRSDLSVSADVRTELLDEQAVTSAPDLVVRDSRTGARLHRVQYDEATGRLLPKGHGYRWVTDRGTTVLDEDVRYYEVVDGREYEVSPREPTLGRERRLSPIEWVWLDELDEFLATETYELWADTPEDVEQLYSLAEYVRKTGEAPVLPVVLQRSFRDRWGIVTPQFYGDTFSLLLRVTGSRVEPHHFMAAPEERRPAGHVRRRFRQDSPVE